MSENAIVLAEVSALDCIPRPGGRRIHRSTIARWASRGVRGVKLESWRAGGRRVTSVAAVERFLARLQESESGKGVAR